MKFYGISDIGLARMTNQDAWSAEPDLGFFALADGIGGRKGGEVAAQETIKVISKEIRRLSLFSNNFQETIDFSRGIREAIESANSVVHSMSCENEHLQGMGSTLCCLLSTPQLVYYAHVGDSRVYRFRENRLSPLTYDHSLFARWLAKNQRNTPSPPKNIITRAIGMAKKVNPEIACSPSQPGDLYLLCSDGLTDAVENDELQRILSEGVSLQEISQKMIISAKNSGSNDNITVLTVRI